MNNVYTVFITYPQAESVLKDLVDEGLTAYQIAIRLNEAKFVLLINYTDYRRIKEHNVKYYLKKFGMKTKRAHNKRLTKEVDDFTSN